MIFRKKKAVGAPVPVERIQEMSSVGMSDKDIIKKLKKEGYTYEDIERAMLQAVKEGVGEGPPRPVPAPEPEVARPVPAPAQMEGGYGAEPSTLEEVYGKEPSEGTPEMPTSIPELTEDVSGELETPEPDVIIEELVEGVIEEKWQRFTEKLEKFEERIDRIKEYTKEMESKLEIEKQDLPTKEMEGKLSDQAVKLEDLEARVGGLEKAFRQFLPSLTRNIENLSNIIHEMKEKTGPA